MRVKTTIIALFLAWAPLGAGAQESRQALFDEVTSLRLKLERLDDAKTAVESQRAGMEMKLDKLAGEIERRKSGNGGEGLLPDFTLQEMLRRSRELSETLTLLNRELEALDDTRADRLEQLAVLYTSLVEQTVEQIKTTGKGERPGLLKTLDRLRQERSLVYKHLAEANDRPGSRTPLDSDEMLASEDPEELMERVDAVRDEQDRLRKRLASLDGRIVDVEEQIRLDREMRDFVHDQALFGEESRILQVSKTGAQEGAGDNREQGFVDEGTKNDEPGPMNGEPDDMDYAEPSTEAGECTGGFCGTPDGAMGGSSDASADGMIETVEGRVPMGLDADDSDLEKLSPATQLKILRASRREVVEQIKKLQILHDRIQEKVDTMRKE